MRRTYLAAIVSQQMIKHSSAAVVPNGPCKPNCGDCVFVG